MTIKKSTKSPTAAVLKKRRDIREKTKKDAQNKSKLLTRLSLVKRNNDGKGGTTEINGRKFSLLSLTSAKLAYKNMFSNRAEMGITLTFSHEIEANQNSGVYDSIQKKYLPQRDTTRLPYGGFSVEDLRELHKKEKGGKLTIFNVSSNARKRIQKWYEKRHPSECKIPPAAFYINHKSWINDSKINREKARDEWTPADVYKDTYFATVPKRPLNKGVIDMRPLKDGFKWRYSTDGDFLKKLEETPPWRCGGVKDGIQIPIIMTDGQGRGRRIVWQQKRWRTMAAPGYSQNPDYIHGIARIYDMNYFPQTTKLQLILKKKLKRDMACEVNIYAHKKSNIPFHTDVERRVVVACRLGKSMYMMFCLFAKPPGKSPQPVDVPYIIKMPGECIYIMSEGCAGWKNLGGKHPTGSAYKDVHWKHAAGHDIEAMCGKKL